MFTYAVPSALRGALQPGSRVAVSFSRRKLAGFVVGGRDDLPEGVSRALPVAGLLEPEPVFTPELLRFLDQAAKYYMHPLGEVLRAAAPALPAGAMRRLRADGFLEPAENLPGQRVAHHTTWKVTPTGKETEGIRLGARQKKLMDRLANRESVLLDELRGELNDPRAVVRSLVGKGLVAFEEVEASRDPFFRAPVTRDAPHPPTDAQQLAIDAINEAILGRTGEAFLLHGVTGSGKTEVYLRAIDEVRKAGRGAILLVPEIALTPQLVGRFRARFGDDIAVLHSGLTARQRDDAWQALRRGRVQVAIGARSALFAPVADLGLSTKSTTHPSNRTKAFGITLAIWPCCGRSTRGRCASWGARRRRWRRTIGPTRDESGCSLCPRAPPAPPCLTSKSSTCGGTEKARRVTRCFRVRFIPRSAAV